MNPLQNIADQIIAYMNRCGGTARSWYVGITCDARSRLFDDHGVHEQNDPWIFQDAGTSQNARTVERFFLNRIGTAGGSGGGDASSRFVYAYRMTHYTRQ